MKTLHCNVPPYEGSEPFVFFSYAPQDRGIAYPMLERMNQQRVRVWYDNGSMPADVRSKTMAERLRACKVCVFLQTEKASAYHFCRVAAMNAFELKKPMLPLLYDGDELSLGMTRLFDKATKLDCPALPEDDFVRQLCSHELLQPCLGAEVVVICPQDYHLDWEEPQELDAFDASHPPESDEPVQPKPSQEPAQPAEPVKPAEPVQPAKPASPPQKPVQPVKQEIADNPESIYDKTIPDDRFEDDMDATIADTADALPVVVHVASGRMFQVQPGETMMGRGKGCPIRIQGVDKSLSRMHARLLLVGGACSLQDMNSTNGTFLDGQKLDKDAVVAIQQDAEFRLAHDTFFLALSPRSEKLWHAEQLITLQSAKNLETLYVFEETQLLGRSHPWPKGAMTARNISHQHAQLTIAGGACTVTDLGSVNGTYLNGQRLVANTPAALTPGDRIVMGDETLIYNCIRLQKEEQA